MNVYSELEMRFNTIAGQHKRKPRTLGGLPPRKGFRRVKVGENRYVFKRISASKYSVKKVLYRNPKINKDHLTDPAKVGF